MPFEVNLETSCTVSKKMSTARKTGSGDDDVVICSISVKGIGVSREHMETFCGQPLGAMANLYNQHGVPNKPISFLLPKDVLLCTGTIEHRRESGASVAKLSLIRAGVSSQRFNLDTPDDSGARSKYSFTLTWKAAGDEVDDVRALLGNTCALTLKFIDDSMQQVPLWQGSPVSLKAEKAAGAKQKIDRKRKASGEKESDSDSTPPPPVEDAAKPAAEKEKPAKKLPDLSIDKLTREAKELATKHPRKTPAPSNAKPFNRGKH